MTKRTSMDLLLSAGVVLGLAAAGMAADGQQAGVASAGQAVQPSMAPTAVDPVAGSHALDSVFRADIDEALMLPNHPPIDQIPPIPMPEPTDGPVAPGDGSMSIYDAETGETINIAADQFGSRVEGAQGDAFNGLAENGEDELLRSFGSMFTVGAATTFPRSGNCKLVMRFVNTSGNNVYFVCSGTMADSGTVLTAAHCVYNRDPSINNWASEIWVYPGWDGNGSHVGPSSSTVFQHWGVARGTAFGAGTNYINNGDWDADWGLVRINRSGSLGARNIGMLTGWYGWAWGGSDATVFSRLYQNYSFPAENCPDAGLHNGRDMYFWSGTVDSTPGNQFQLNTGGGGCFNTVWGGMSGSGMYYVDGTSRYVHGICSTSNRTTIGRYCRQTEGWVSFMQDFENAGRGTTFDIEALMFRVGGSTSVTAGNSLPASTVKIINATNANPGASTYRIRVYLSSNNNISTSDTLLATWDYNTDFAAMQTRTFNVPGPFIPVTTAPGSYFVGVIIDDSEDTNDANSDTDTWDATPVTVGLGLPATAASPVPVNFATNVSNVTNLDWASSARASSYNVYFGTDSTPDAGEFIGNRTSSFYDLGTLGFSTTYYWRVDSLNSTGTTTGPVWRFTTGPQPLPDLLASAVDAEDGGHMAGDVIRVDHQERNIGNATSNAYTVRVYLSTDATISSRDTLIGSRSLGALGVGGSRTSSTDASLPRSLPAGSYFVGTLISSSGESTTANNTLADRVPITIGGPCGPADLVPPFGQLDIFDIIEYLGLFDAGDRDADLVPPTGLDIFDIIEYLSLFDAGCG